MSNTAIDQLFPSVPPTAKVGEPARAGHESGDAFRAHLDRATETTEAKPRANSNDIDTVPADEEEPLHSLDTQTGEHEEASTTDEEQVETVSKAAEQPAEEAVAEEPSGDEVTLSAAAAAVAQEAEVIVVDSSVAVDGPVVIAASSSTGDQQSSEQPPQETAAPVTSGFGGGTEVAQIETLAAPQVQTEEAALQTEVGQAENNVAAAASLAKANGDAGQPSAEARVESTGQPIGQAGSGDTASTGNSGQQSAGNQQDTNLPQALTDTDVPEQAASSTESRSTAFTANLNAATSELAATIDTEGAFANLPDTAEAAPSPTGGPSATSSPQALANLGRSVSSTVANNATEASGTTNEPQGPELTTVDRARFVRRVGGAIRSAQSRDGNIQLRLSPPELGTLRIQIAVKEGVVTAHLETDNTAARTLLLDNLPALRERLAEQEIRIEKFDVDVGRDDERQADHPEAEDRENKQSRFRRDKQAETKRTAEAVAPDTSSQTPHPGTLGELDVRI